MPSVDCNIMRYPCNVLLQIFSMRHSAGHAHQTWDIPRPDAQGLGAGWVVVKGGYNMIIASTYVIPNAENYTNYVRRAVDPTSDSGGTKTRPTKPVELSPRQDIVTSSLEFCHPLLANHS